MILQGDMKRFISIFVILTSVIMTGRAQTVSYNIISECDTTIKTKVGGVTLSSRDVRYYLYEYTSQDADGKPATISGVIMIPSNVMDGTPCDGIMLYNRATLSSPDEAPSTGNAGLLNGLIANPLRPNYILIMSDFIGYGSSLQYPMFYHSGDVNARNSLDGLLAARQLLTDKQIPQGKYLFNLGFSQGGSESLYVAKLRDMEYKDKGVTFTKTFAGGGPTDYVIAYKEYVKKDACEDVKDVVLMMVSAIENLHLDINYSDIFKEPLASIIPDLIKRKDKGVFGEVGIGMEDSLSNLIQPVYMDLESKEAKDFMAALEKINLMNGWVPDTSQKYFIEHSRHDNYVPIQCVRAIIPWMEKQGFKPSLVPGKTNLQTNTMVFKCNHTLSAIIWLIQTMAAIQFWPVVYYEGDQNRYYHDVVKDLNLMKVVKYLEGWGLDLRKLTSNAPSLQSSLRAAIVEDNIDPQGSIAQLADSRRADIFELFEKISGVLSKLDLTMSDALEMLQDAGISVLDILEVVQYFQSSSASARSASVVLTPSLQERVEGPVYLLQLYEKILADWYKQGGIDVAYDKWGWNTSAY